MAKEALRMAEQALGSEPGGSALRGLRVSPALSPLTDGGTGPSQCSCSVQNTGSQKQQQSLFTSEALKDVPVALEWRDSQHEVEYRAPCTTPTAGLPAVNCQAWHTTVNHGAWPGARPGLRPSQFLSFIPVAGRTQPSNQKAPKTKVTRRGRALSPLWLARGLPPFIRFS